MKSVTMMRTASLAVWAVVFPVAAGAQLTLGVGTGVSLASFVGDDAGLGVDGEKRSRVGLSVGAWLAIPLAGRLSIVPGARYMQKGVEYSTGDPVVLRYKIDYIEIPVSLAARLTDEDGIGLHVFVGPAIAFEVRCEAEDPSGYYGSSPPLPDCGPATDFGISAGANVSGPLENGLSLLLSGGVDIGLRKLDTSDASGTGRTGKDVRNRAFFVSVGLGIPIG